LTNEFAFAKAVKEELIRILKWKLESVPKLDDQQIENVGEEILSAQNEKGENLKAMVLGGWGRSGGVAQGFAMRLAHLKFNVRYITEPTVPPTKKSDLFIIVSGSGESFTRAIETALRIGAKIVVITSLPDSIGARSADIKLIVPGRESEEGSSLSFLERQMKGIPAFPLGTAFEDLAQVFLDSVITVLAVIKKKSNEDMKREHSNVIPE
jgi:6-phospho-3-hexuloisomerase